MQRKITEKQRKFFKEDCIKFLSSMESKLVETSPLNYTMLQQYQELILAISFHVKQMLKRNLKIKFYKELQFYSLGAGVKLNQQFENFS